MSWPAVDSRIVDAIDEAQAATLDHQVVRTDGAGKAYHAVAQAAAIAVQDAADALRSMTAIASTAAGVALAQYLATGDPRFLDALDRSRGLVDQAIADYAAIGAASARIVTDFPAG
ncbi:MAG TPA: hypothetical protein VGB79_11075 [Allosphingosinicella sp.]|jgi:hypothetical protein